MSLYLLREWRQHKINISLAWAVLDIVNRVRFARAGLVESVSRCGKSTFK